MRENRVVRDPQVFSEEYQPSEVAFRRLQITSLRFCLGEGKTGPVSCRLSAFLYGPSGTGKSTVIKRVLAGLKTRAPAVTVSCFEAKTLHAILEKTVAELQASQGLSAIRPGLFEVPRVSTVRNKEKLRRFLKGRPLIVVLEDIDKLPPHVVEEIIYNLRDIEGITLILTAQSWDILDLLESRVMSRLRPCGIAFPPYSREQMRHILKDRAERGLARSFWDNGLLRVVADVARGNARSAISALERVALVGEREGLDAIPSEMIAKAAGRANGSDHARRLRGLNRHHAALCQVVRERGKVASPELKKAYLEYCKKAGEKPMAERTIRAYMSELTRRGLVSQEPAATARGEAKLFRPGQL